MIAITTKSSMRVKALEMRFCVAMKYRLFIFYLMLCLPFSAIKNHSGAIKFLVKGLFTRRLIPLDTEEHLDN
jgi:hypothetical protein